MPFNATAVRAYGWVAAGAAALLLAVALFLSMGGVASADVPGLETKVASGTANANSVKTLGVSCSSGKKALGGGFEVDPSGVVQVVVSGPNGATGDGSDNAGGWIGAFLNTSGSTQNVHVWVVCATIGA